MVENVRTIWRRKTGGLAFLVGCSAGHRVAVGVVGFDDALDERVADDVGAAERVEIDARNVAEDVAHLEEPGLFRFA